MDSFGRQLKEDNITAYASSCAFFIFLSLIPMIMLLLAILPYTPIDPALLTKWVLEELPAGTGNFVISVLEEISTRSIGLISVTAVLTLWSAGKGINSLIAGFNAIDKNVDKRNGLLVRVIACLYTLVFLVGVIFMMIFVHQFFIFAILVHKGGLRSPFYQPLAIPSSSAIFAKASREFLIVCSDTQNASLM